MLLQCLLVFSLPRSNTTLHTARTTWGPSCSTWLKMLWQWTRGRLSSWWVCRLRSGLFPVKMDQNCWDLDLSLHCRLWRTNTLARSCWRWAASLGSSPAWWRTWLLLCSAAPEPNVDISGLTLLHFKMDPGGDFSFFFLNSQNCFYI